MAFAAVRPDLKNPHLLTIAGNTAAPRSTSERFPTREKLYNTEPGVQVLVHRKNLTSGLKAASTASNSSKRLEGRGGGLRLSLAQAALEAGYAVPSVSMRSCGGREAVCGDNTLSFRAD